MGDIWCKQTREFKPVPQRAVATIRLAEDCTIHCFPNIVFADKEAVKKSNSPGFDFFTTSYIVVRGRAPQQPLFLRIAMSSTLDERKSHKKALRRLVEFHGIARGTLQQYRKRV